MSATLAKLTVSTAFIAVVLAGMSTFLGCGGGGRGASRDSEVGSGGAGTGGLPGSAGAGAGVMGGGGTTGGGGMTGSGGLGTAGKGAGGPTAAAPCPARPPTSGSVCVAPVGDSGRCSWGESPRLECRTLGTCNGTWTIVGPPEICATVDPACPSVAPSDFATCSATSLGCLYAAKLCSCTPCNSDGAPGPPFIRCNGQPFGTPVWNCDVAPAPSPSCPSGTANRGAACSLPATMGCPLGTCGELNVVCSGGVWTWTRPPITCPSCIRECATCASPDTPIATPDGDRAIAEIRAGDLVYSIVDHAIRPVVVMRVNRTPVVNHHVVRVTTAEGRVLEISAGHPTADGRLFGDLHPSSLLDGHLINSVEIVPYSHGETYDILPASEGGEYFAAGMLIGSTLAK